MTTVIRENAKAYIQGPSSRKPDVWIEIDRDAQPDGVAGIYDKVKREFWAAIDSGKAPGLRTSGTGSDSSDCPAVAVGNVPWNGSNPPKCLDAVFDSVRVKNADGEWVEATRGEVVRVARGRPVIARVDFTNLGEARLLAGRNSSAPGGVSVIALCSEQDVWTPLGSDASYLASCHLGEVMVCPAGIDEPAEVILTFEAQGRTRFGERLRIHLEP